MVASGSVHLQDGCKSQKAVVCHTGREILGMLAFLWSGGGEGLRKKGGRGGAGCPSFNQLVADGLAKLIGKVVTEALTFSLFLPMEEMEECPVRCQSSRRRPA